MKKEIQLGLFVLVGLVVFGISILTVKNIHVESGYRFHAMFSNAGGLLEKAWVRTNGVKIGRVETITLEGRQARVIAWIEKGVELHSDSKASIMASGMLGVKYLEVTQGSKDKPLLKNGDVIMGNEPVGLDTVMNKIFEGGFADNLVDTSRNIKDLSDKINNGVSDKKIAQLIEKIDRTATHLERISRNIDEITGQGKGDIADIIKNLKSTTERIDRILASVERGDSAVGKLLNDKEVGDDLKKTIASLRDTSNEAKKTVGRFTLFKTNWNYELRADLPNERYKSDVGVEIRPKDEKFYYLGVNNLTTDTEVNPPEKENTFDANIGRDFGWYSLYAGILRSSGGFGVKVRPFWKSNMLSRFEIKAQGRDFTRKTPKKAAVDVNAKVKIGKYTRIGIGYEDISVINSMHGYFNIVIDDEDIAYLLGLVSL